LQPQTRQRWSSEVDLWLTDQGDDAHLSDYRHAPLSAAALDLDHCSLSLCTSGSSGEPKRIDKNLRQLANEVEALERLWGADLGPACIIGSVATQHIYGLLFRVLWPLCAGRVRAQATGVPGRPATHQPRAFGLRLGRQPGAAQAYGRQPRLARLERGAPGVFLRRRAAGRGRAKPARTLAAMADGDLRQLGNRRHCLASGAALWQPFADVTLSQDNDGALLIASPYLPAGHIEHTADAARIAADGRFELLGRLDRIVKLEEKRISLPMLEQALMDHDWIAEARLGVVQENRASLGALLVLSEAGLHALRNQGRRTLTEQLRQHLSLHCEALALPRRWRLLRQMPLNAQGKLPQADVEALLLAPRPKAPQVLEQVETDGEWSLQLAVPPDLAYFSGHFPKAPVLPGVVQVEWALSLGQQLMNLPEKFAGMEVLKFQQLVRPGDEVQLHLRFDPVRGKLYFAYRNETATCSSGRILLEPAHA
jgi:3-hydroxymyristoyl/3-hydroxydecanoyl-(acyl carrier protein) dehydratase